MRVAVIGGGISGITAAHVLQKNGFEAVVFEKSGEAGGVWALAYPDIRLQNIFSHYQISDISWPFWPRLHPSAEEILYYVNEVVEQQALQVRLRHEVLKLEEQANGWKVYFRNHNGVQEEDFDYGVIAIGQYTEGKHTPVFPGQNEFEGTVITERDVRTLDIFHGQSVAVVGFGKSALDMATLAASKAAQVHHVFRTPHWLFPQVILGLHFADVIFNRFGATMMPCWTHPTAIERFLHKQKFLIHGFWGFISFVIQCWFLHFFFGKDRAARERLKTVRVRKNLLRDLGSQPTLVPNDYLPLVAKGRILPYHTGITGFSKNAMQLGHDKEIICDMVLLCTGSKTPIFPFMPEHYRAMLESEDDGVQLYRHLIHPRIPRLAFAGFNHGIMHIPAVEVGMQWICAYWQGDLELPPVEEMERSIEYIRNWKREHIDFDPSRSCKITIRFQQYIDILLKDLGVSPYRKLPNIFAEFFDRYRSHDYQGVLEEYNRKKTGRAKPLHPFPLDT